MKSKSNDSDIGKSTNYVNLKVFFLFLQLNSMKTSTVKWSDPKLA